MTAFDAQHSLWTYDERAEWTERNAGVSDRLLMKGLSVEAAMSGANHLADIYRGDVFEVRDIRDTTVHVAGNEERAAVVESAQRRAAGRRVTHRRKLGTRESFNPNL